MITTIFCTFHNQDDADFARGRLNTEHDGIRSVSQVTGYGQSPSMFSMRARVAAEKQQRVTLRIVCANTDRNAVLSRLVNLHASGIITTP